MPLPPATSPLPLFDRFGMPFDEAPGAPPGAAEALQHSLQRDLLRLFNTRNRLTIDQFLAEGPSALDYGLPDTLALSAQSATDLQRWERVILRAIALYEPRLVQVRVKVTPDAVRPAAARVVIDAVASLGRQLCQFHFNAPLDNPAREQDSHV